MDTWITADLHFGHEKILQYQPDRPGESIEEMNETIIENYNAVVDKRDNVWIIGDFSLTSDRKMVRKCLYALKGSKHLVVGNHDPNWLLDLPDWASITQMRHMTVAANRFFLCHYPMLTWDGAHRGVFNLHGHTHGMLNPAWSNPAQLDVGIDCHKEFRPFHIDEVLENLNPYLPIDKHGPK
jgi:calcineurin-like phosphoesterase family protein